MNSLLSFSSVGLVLVCAVACGGSETGGGPNAGRGSGGGAVSATSEGSASGASGAGSGQARSSGVAESGADDGQVRVAPYGLEPWHDDFPVALELSPDRNGVPFIKSSRLLLEKLIKNLQGNCTRNAWLFAREYFDRAPETVVPMLLDELDRTYQAKHLGDYAENLVEALGRLGRFESEEVAEAVLRAFDHPKSSVLGKATRAMRGVGTKATLMRAFRRWDSLSRRSKLDWVRAVRTRLPNEVVSIYRDLMMDPRYQDVFPTVVQEASQLELEQAAELFRPMWDGARKDLRLVIAGVLHGVGDERGRVFLRQALRSELPMTVVSAIVQVQRGEVEPVLEDILRLVEHPSPEVRLAVCGAIARKPGENYTNLLATYAIDGDDNVRQLALAALRERGARDHLDHLVDTLRKASGTKLVQTMADLSSAGDERAIPVIYERYKQVEPKERQAYLRSMARSKTKAAFPVLREVFLAPEGPISRGNDYTTWTYLGVVMANLNSSGHELLDLFEELDPTDYRRRGILLHTVSGMAGLTDDTEFAERTRALQRNILRDPKEAPQMRLLALQDLRRALTIADAKALQKLVRSEVPGMARALQNFLHEYY